MEMPTLFVNKWRPSIGMSYFINGRGSGSNGRGEFRRLWNWISDRRLRKVADLGLLIDQR